MLGKQIKKFDMTDYFSQNAKHILGAYSVFIYLNKHITFGTKGDHLSLLVFVLSLSFKQNWSGSFEFIHLQFDTQNTGNTALLDRLLITYWTIVANMTLVKSCWEMKINSINRIHYGNNSAALQMQTSWCSWWLTKLH